MTGSEEVSLLLVSWWLAVSSSGGRDRERFLPFLVREAKASSSSDEEEVSSKPLRGRRFTILRDDDVIGAGDSGNGQAVGRRGVLLLIAVFVSVVLCVLSHQRGG